jgi:hypothetical protein
MSEESNATAEAVEETTETAAVEETTETAAPVEVPEPEDISYHAVEKEGNVTALWEMQGRKHLRTIDPRSNEGKQILALFESAA